MEDQELDQEEVQEQEQEQDVDPQIEDEAKLMGWIPKDEFRGDLDKWRPADEYVKRGREILPIMKAQTRKYEDNIRNLQAELGETKRTMEKVLKMSDSMAERAFVKAKLELEEAQIKAVEDGNTVEWMRLKKEEENLQPPEKVTFNQPATSSGDDDPVYNEWHIKNQWFKPQDPDDEPTLFANSWAQRHPRQPNEDQSAWLRKAEEATRKALPHRFTNPNRSTESAVENTGVRSSGNPTPKKKSYDGLPADAKKQCDKWIKQGLTTKERYVSDYYEDEE
jgi:hypothetical protein